MRNDYKLIRQILLLVESEQILNLIISNSFNKLRFNSKDFYLPKEASEKEIVFYHLDFLEKKDFISQRYSVSGKDRSYSRINLETQGHDFLDAVRNDKVFDKLLQKIAQVGDSVALETLKSLALDISLSIFK